MQNGFEQHAGEEAPLYIRWNPDRSPYAIELRLEVVAEIADQLAQADKLSIEVGGVLIGSFPSAHSPTLRIEDVEIVPRGMEEGAVYVLDPSQHGRLGEIRVRARARQRDTVGFFRSHLRPGAMRPSLADRSLLSGEFRDSMYAVLLIEGREPHTATFFLAANGHLPGEPSVRNFRFEEREFRALPEVPPAPAAAPAREPWVERKQRAGSRVSGARPFGAKAYGTMAVLLAIGVAASILMWSFSRHAPIPHILGEANPLSLSVTDRGLLRIAWDHAAHELDGASGATVVIVDGPSRREFQLGVDELRLGAVEYERMGAEVQVTMTVDTPGSASSNQTVDWVKR